MGSYTAFEMIKNEMKAFAIERVQNEFTIEKQQKEFVAFYSKKEKK